MKRHFKTFQGFLSKQGTVVKYLHVFASNWHPGDARLYFQFAVQLLRDQKAMKIIERDELGRIVQLYEGN